MFVIGSVHTTWLFWCNLSYCWTVCEILKTPSSSLLCRFIWHRHHFPFLHSRLFLGIFSRTHFSTRSSSCYTSDLVRILMHRISKKYAKPTLQRSSIANNMTAMPHLNWKYLHNVVHASLNPLKLKPINIFHECKWFWKTTFTCFPAFPQISEKESKKVLTIAKRGGHSLERSCW